MKKTYLIEFTTDYGEPRGRIHNVGEGGMTHENTGR